MPNLVISGKRNTESGWPWVRTLHLNISTRIRIVYVRMLVYPSLASQPLHTDTLRIATLINCVNIVPLDHIFCFVKTSSCIGAMFPQNSGNHGIRPWVLPKMSLPQKPLFLHCKQYKDKFGWFEVRPLIYQQYVHVVLDGPHSRDGL